MTQMPFDFTVGTGIQQKQNVGGMNIMNKQLEVKVLAVSDKRERVEMEARLSTVMTVVHRLLYHLLSVANGTRKITVIDTKKQTFKTPFSLLLPSKDIESNTTLFTHKFKWKKLKGTKRLFLALKT